MESWLYHSEANNRVYHVIHMHIVSFFGNDHVQVMQESATS